MFTVNVLPVACKSSQTIQPSSYSFVIRVICTCVLVCAQKGEGKNIIILTYMLGNAYSVYYECV